MIHVVVADDQALIRAGLRGILEGEADVEVVAEAADGREAVEAARLTGADVVLMDVRMPGVDGIEATRLIRADATLAHVRVLVLTTFETDDYVDRALTAGADGFLGKGAAPRELVDAVRVVAQGGSSLSSRAARGLIDRLRASAPSSRGADDAAARALVARLTDRERDVLRRVASGASNEEIAAALVLSPLTVKTHVNRAMTKVGAHDRAQLVVLAYEAGLLPLQ